MWCHRSGVIECRPTAVTLNEISSLHNDSLVMTNRRARSPGCEIEAVGRKFNVFAANPSVARSLR